MENAVFIGDDHSYAENTLDQKESDKPQCRGAGTHYNQKTRSIKVAPCEL